MSLSSYPVVVAIPAKDERELLPRCLQAIARQVGADLKAVAVVISCNNCTDDTAQVVRNLRQELPYSIYVDEILLPAPIAHAGGARRCAMDKAATLCRPDGLILTTDADGMPDPDWISAYAGAFSGGGSGRFSGTAAAVSGRVSTDWEELQRFPTEVLDVGAREWEYQGLSAELDALCDPEAHDPWPRHNQTCGANAAITREWYERIGGLPVLRTGEDGAMFQEVWRRDGLIRHDLRPHVTVSARLVGRAQGGMADALSSRHGDQYLCDDLLEPADDLKRRSSWRHGARVAFASGELESWALARGARPDWAEEAGKARYFGEAWLSLEHLWPALAKRRIAAPDIDQELVRIKQLLSEVRDRSAQAEAPIS